MHTGFTADLGVDTRPIYRGGGKLRAETGKTKLLPEQWILPDCRLVPGINRPLAQLAPARQIIPGEGFFFIFFLLETTTK